MEERDVLRAYVTRRGKGEPLQYITGEVGFRHITVKVRPGVLIPRPETEVLVSEALALLPAAPKRVAQHAWPEDDLPPVPWPEGEAGEQRPERTADQGVAEDESTPAVASGEPAPEPPELLVADLCTGSGCIACSVAYEHPLARVVATDIVPEAVALARDNVAALELGDRVEVLSCDLGEGVDPTLMGAFDLVVSNPPYVPTAVMDDIPREVAEFEPALALDGGADGLDRAAPPASLVPPRPQGGRRLRLRAARDLPGRGRPPCRRGRLLRCSRHGRSRRAPPRPHRPKARRVDGSSGRRGFRASPGASGRTRRPARAGQAYALPVARFRPRMCGKNEVLAVIGRFPAPSSKDAERNPRSRFAIPAKRGARAGRRCQNLDFAARDPSETVREARQRRLRARSALVEPAEPAEPAPNPPRSLLRASVRPGRSRVDGYNRTEPTNGGLPCLNATSSTTT